MPSPHHPSKPAEPFPKRPIPAGREPLAMDFSGVAALDPPVWFGERTSDIGIEFEEGDTRALGMYLAILMKANESLNLTSVTEFNAVWEKHILDSLTLLSVLSDLQEGARVIDVGSGGGLPGIPLAICMPALRFTLLEATGKKAEFLRAAVEKLGLTNVDVLHARAEVAAHDRGEKTGTGRVRAHRESYDAVVARAVGRLPMLLELTLPFAKAGGFVAVVKGAQAAKELEEAQGALQILKGGRVQTIAMPTNTLVVVDKVAATPKTYPRADGEPARAPLGVMREEEEPQKDRKEARDGHTEGRGRGGGRGAGRAGDRRPRGPGR